MENGRKRRFDSKTGEQILESHYTDGEKSGHWKQYNATDETTREWDE